ncbi:hypothetical protein GCM10022223_59060 [Kineosporia mesophila]|uniref:LppA-like lipoprotein n=1 Tax=Kineosporia mesophila TaxID=566012 RepID=A0ABP7AHP5_9ACTN
MRPGRFRARRAGLVIAVVGIALIGAGCGETSMISESSSKEEALRELQSRPSFEQADRDQKAMLGEIRSVYEDLAPTVKWDRPGPRVVSGGTCLAPFRQIDGVRSYTYDAGVGEGNTPDAVWPEVKQKMLDIAAQYGYTEVNQISDEPRKRVLTVGNGIGGTLEVGEYDNTTITVSGACYLKDTKATEETTSS